MARQSQRLSSGTTSNPGHKRAASGSTAANADVKKAKTKKATPTKSQYFKDEDEMVKTEASDDEMLSSAPEEEQSDFASASDGDDDDEVEEDDDYASEDEAPKPRKRSSTKQAAAAVVTEGKKGSEVWREGVKTGLGPGKQLVIKKAKARSAGKVPYTDESIHPNTLLFLTDLKANNDREWLKRNDPDFRQAEKDWYSFAAKLTDRLTEIDETIPELPVKDIIFRIYRDVRFSKDPTPYKPFFSAVWSRTGRKGPYAGYYMQVTPDNETFVGGGLYGPEAAAMAVMRRDIDRHPRHLKDVLLLDGMRNEFLGGVPKQDVKTVKAFVAHNKNSALKTRPKGYDADHAEIDLLRLRNFTVLRKVTDKELTGTGGLDRIAELFGSIQPFITYLNSVVMPDDAGSSSSGEDDEEEEGEDDEDEEEE